MILIDEPRPAKISDYEHCIREVTDTIADIPGVVAVYQIGGLSSPGISDIDIMVIFENGVNYFDNPRMHQSEMSDYLFAHNLFGTSTSMFEESKKFTFFHNYKLLHGKKMRTDASAALTEDDKIMQRQLAREFLVRMLVNLTVEREYGIYKIRSLLLQGKALLYDLEFLEEEPELLLEVIRQIYDFRENWFSNRPSNNEIEVFYQKFWNTLVEFLDDHLSGEPLYLPNKDTHQVGRNIYLHNSEKVSGISTGLKFPWVPKQFARKAIAIQHRLNKIEIGIPIQKNNIPDRISESFEYSYRARDYNQKHLPHFMPLTSSLAVS